MRKALISLPFLLLVFSTVVVAHEYNQTIGDAGWGVNANYLGYGYSRTDTSDVEALSQTTFTCQSQEIRQYIAGSCRQLPTNSTAAQMRSFVRANMKPMVVQKFRNKIFEYLAMQKKAAYLDKPHGQAKPPCVTSGSSGTLFASYPQGAIPTTDSSFAQPGEVTYMDAFRSWRDWDRTRHTETPDPTARARYSAYKESIERFDRVRATYKPEQMVTAVMMYDQYMEYHRQVCTPTGAIERIVLYFRRKYGSFDRSNFCLDTNDAIRRIKETYPNVFTNREVTNRIRGAGMDIIGSTLAGPNASPQRIRRLGRRRWRQRLVRDVSTTSTTMGFTQFSTEFNNIYRRLNPRNTDYSRWSRTYGTRTANLRTRLNNYAGKVARDIVKNRPNICNLSFNDMLMRYPQVYRQMMLDMPQDEREAAKAVWCIDPHNSSWNYNSTTSCRGVTGGPLSSGNWVSINRTTYQPPYGTLNKFFVRKDSDGKLEVRLEMNFEKGRGISDADFNAKKALFLSQAQTFYQTQSANMNPQPTPAVKFSFRNKTSGEPSMKIHQCYNADTGSTNCNQSPRADAGNLHANVSSGTVAHEFGHVLGLPDEYQDPTYVFNPQGETNSIMRNSNAHSPDLTPRHISQIVGPALRCRP